MEKSLNSNENFSAVFLNQRDHYFSNAQDMIKKGEIRKASEMLWGAIAQEIKFLASLRSVQLRSHKNIKEFVKQIAKEERNEKIYETLLELESLHRYFYDEDIMDAEDFPMYYDKVKKFLEILEDVSKKLYKSPR